MDTLASLFDAFGDYPLTTALVLVALAGGLAEALGGSVAGDPRRMRDLSEHFAVVCASVRPAELLDLQFGLAPDPFGWRLPVGE